MTRKFLQFKWGSFRVNSTNFLTLSSSTTLKKLTVWPSVMDSFYYPRVIIFVLLNEWQKYCGTVEKELVWIHFCWVSKSVRLLIVARFESENGHVGQVAAKNNLHHCKEHGAKTLVSFVLHQKL